MLVQARPVFVFAEREYKTKQKKFPTSPLWDLWVKITHLRLAARLIEIENNSR